MDNGYGFKRPGEYGAAVITENLEANLRSWLTWSLLGTGAFDNIVQGQAGAYGGNLSRLRPATDERYPARSVWEASRGDWVWESGLSYATQPKTISGLWVNSTWVPATSVGPYAHYVDYLRGRVVFASSIPATAVVQMEYSRRSVQVRGADEPWFREVVFGTYRADRFDLPSPSGGAWGTLAEERVQLPAIVIEPTLYGTAEPYEIGSDNQRYQTDFLLHVLAETPWDRKRLRDLLVCQKDKTLKTFDVAQTAAPLDPLGRLTPGALTYPQSCEQAPWRPVTIARVVVTDQQPLGRYFWWATVRYTLDYVAP